MTDGRGKHGNQGRPKKKDARTKNINIRLNSIEHAEFIECQKISGMSQADLICFLTKRFLKSAIK